MPSYCDVQITFITNKQSQLSEMLKLFHKYTQCDTLDLPELMNDKNMGGPRDLKIFDIETYDFEEDSNNNNNEYNLYCKTRWYFDYNMSCDLQELLKYFKLEEISVDFYQPDDREKGSVNISKDHIDYESHYATDEEVQEAGYECEESDDEE